MKTPASDIEVLFLMFGWVGLVSLEGANVTRMRLAQERDTKILLGPPGAEFNIYLF